MFISTRGFVVLEIALTIAVLAFSFGVQVGFHEVGHALLMRRHGVELKELAIGAKLFPYLRIQSKRLGCPIYLSPWLIIGWVMPTEEGLKQIEELPYKAKSEIYGAGIAANLLLGGLALLALKIAGATSLSWAAPIILIVLAVPLFKIFCWVIMPAAGLGLGVLVVWSVVDWLKKLINHVPVPEDQIPVGGPVSVVSYTQDATNTVAEAAAASGNPVGSILAILLMPGVMIALMLATTNMLPLTPLDGGKTMVALSDRLLGKRSSKAVAIAGGLAFLGLIILAFSVDLGFLK